jgi:hypothetical protein
MALKTLLLLELRERRAQPGGCFGSRYEPDGEAWTHTLSLWILDESVWCQVSLLPAARRFVRFAGAQHGRGTFRCSLSSDCRCCMGPRHFTGLLRWTACSADVLMLWQKTIDSHSIAKVAQMLCMARS